MTCYSRRHSVAEVAAARSNQEGCELATSPGCHCTLHSLTPVKVSSWPLVRVAVRVLKIDGCLTVSWCIINKMLGFPVRKAIVPSEPNKGPLTWIHMSWGSHWNTLKSQKPHSPSAGHAGLKQLPPTWVPAGWDDLPVRLLVKSRQDVMTSWFWSSYLIRLYGWRAFSLPWGSGVKTVVEERTGNLRGRGGGDRGEWGVEVEEEYEQDGEQWGDEEESREEVGRDEELGGIQGGALRVQKRQRASWKRTKQKWNQSKVSFLTRWWW